MTRVCACMRVHVYVCPSQAIPQKLSKVIIIKLGMVTSSDMRMHRMLIILTSTFIQGHTNLNHENNKCLLISETIQSMPIKYAVKIVRCQSYASQTWLLFNLHYIGQYLNYYIQTWHDGRRGLDLCMALNLTLTLTTFVRLVPLFITDPLWEVWVTLPEKSLQQQL